MVSGQRQAAGKGQTCAEGRTTASPRRNRRAAAACHWRRIARASWTCASVRARPCPISHSVSGLVRARWSGSSASARLSRALGHQLIRVANRNDRVDHPVHAVDLRQMGRHHLGGCQPARPDRACQIRCRPFQHGVLRPRAPRGWGGGQGAPPVRAVIGGRRGHPGPGTRPVTAGHFMSSVQIAVMYPRAVALQAGMKTPFARCSSGMITSGAVAIAGSM